MTRYTSAVHFAGRDVFRIATMALVVGLLIFGAQAYATPVPAGADVIFDADGFELPDYTTTFLGSGQLEGQGPAPGFGVVWVRDSGPALGDANVQSVVKESGDQAVQVDRAANDDDRWAVPVSGWPSKRYVCIEWDMRVERTTGPTGSFGPFFGVEGYDDDGVGASNGLLGSLGVDASTGDVLYQEAGTGFLTETGASVAFGEWNSFSLDFDFALKVYSVSLNGTLLSMGGPGDFSETFVDGIGLNQFTDGDIAAIAAAGDAASQALTGTAFIDNFVEYQIGFKIPEPSTFALALLAFVGLPGLRSRRSHG